MADIELVIKMPEEEYKNICLMSKDGIGMALYDWVANGTPLPKGHGDLKDADVMINKLSTHEASELFGSVTCAEIMDFINGEKPIIEANIDNILEDGKRKALEQQPCEDVIHRDRTVQDFVDKCRECGRKKVLDKIRAEIDRIYEREGNSSDCLNALDDLKWFINKCNAESEDK